MLFDPQSTSTSSKACVRSARGMQSPHKVASRQQGRQRNANSIRGDTAKERALRRIGRCNGFGSGVCGGVGGGVGSERGRTPHRRCHPPTGRCAARTWRRRNAAYGDLNFGLLPASPRPRTLCSAVCALSLFLYSLVVEDEMGLLLPFTKKKPKDFFHASLFISGSFPTRSNRSKPSHLLRISCPAFKAWIYPENWQLRDWRCFGHMAKKVILE